MTSPHTDTGAGLVRLIRRYPVKSLSGEDLAQVVIDARGCLADRLWAVRDPDGKLGSGKTTRRFRRMDGLLEVSAELDGDVPVLTFPAGRRVRADDSSVHQALSRHVGRPVVLGLEAEVSHFDEGPLHLVTSSSLETLGAVHGRVVDPRRTRANLVLAWPGQGFPEHDWVGRRLGVGPDVVLRITGLMPRCVMVNAAQGGLPADPGLLRRLGEVTAGMLGVVADVERTGTVTVGDEAALLAPG